MKDLIVEVRGKYIGGGDICFFLILESEKSVEVEHYSSFRYRLSSTSLDGDSVLSDILKDYDFNDEQIQVIKRGIEESIVRIEEEIKEEEEKNKLLSDKATQENIDKYKAFVDEYMSLCLKYGYYISDDVVRDLDGGGLEARYESYGVYIN